MFYKLPKINDSKYYGYNNPQYQQPKTPSLIFWFAGIIRDSL